MGMELGGKVPECCAKTENLERFSDENGNPFAYYLQCRICGRKHRHLMAQPIPLGMKTPPK
jgi:hypothetical protein